MIYIFFVLSSVFILSLCCFVVIIITVNTNCGVTQTFILIEKYNRVYGNFLSFGRRSIHVIHTQKSILLLLKITGRLIMSSNVTSFKSPYSLIISSCVRIYAYSVVSTWTTSVNNGQANKEFTGLWGVHYCNYVMLLENRQSTMF